MKFLELKVPPVVVTLLYLLCMWAISYFTPSISLQNEVKLFASLCLLFLALTSIISGVVTFSNAKTTVDPTKPTSASSLVNRGIFKLSRNPMYLGMLLILIAWTTWLASIYSLLLSLTFILYMNRFQIAPEERALTELFGDEYKQYCSNVRRWI